nr:PAS domain-containing protein [Chelatococcus reniformis]
MIAALPRHRLALGILASVAGIAAVCLTGAAFGLLAVVAALYLHARGRAVRLLSATLAIACAGSIVAALLYAGDTRDLAVSWAALSAVALCIGAVVAATAPTPLSAAESEGRLSLRVGGPDNREQDLRQLIDAVPALIWSTTREGTPTYVNKRFTDVIGATLADITAPDGTLCLSVVHSEDRPAAARAFARSLATGVPYTMKYRQLRSGGAYRWTETRAEPLHDGRGGILRWYGVSVDIDDVVSAQEALAEREQELSQLVDMVPSYLWRLSRDGEPNFFNKRLIDFLGLGVADADRPGMSRLAALVEAVVHPDDAARVEEALQRCLVTGECFAMRLRLRRGDGVFRWMSGSAEPMRDQGGCIVHWYGLFHDIDDQLHAEEAVRRSERELQQLIDALPVHIWSWTPEGKLSYVSRRYLEHLGLSEVNFEDFTRVVQALVHPEDGAEVQRTAARCLQTGAPFVMRYRRRCLDGAYRWMEGRCEPLRDQDGTIVHWYHVSIDIDDGVRAQEDLRLAQENLARQSQAASLAELSASIAHEVNQPLAAVVANSHACQRWLAADPPNVQRARKTVERITRDANAAADVVSRIRALFRQSMGARICTPLDDVIAEVRDLVAEEASRRGVRLDVQVESGLPPVALDRVQIQQVLINLLRNGMEAMDATAGDRVLGLCASSLGKAIRMEISDRGGGIERPEGMFEPFFTTKPNGMGMGLAICRSIVESHAGRLWAEKNEPHGAKLIFTLPIEVKATP